ncbi:hypothetical protein VaNZ11_017079 [Volvox africanus]|uniref:Uncharacterized protein n=1 Tax=Volvox africanus TaxID=51714 RepID=A0ABQ5SQR4_9CHLO|nr:hypothetical protein VaNZ11_017079 [Volvox africanus]
MELLNLNAVARIKSLRSMGGVDCANQSLINIVESPSGVAFPASTPITTSAATSPSVSVLTGRPASDSYAASVAPTATCSPTTTEDGSGGAMTSTPPLKCDTSSELRVPHVGQDHLRYKGAEDALARALDFILKLEVSEGVCDSKVLEAQAAVAEAVPLVWGLRKEIDGLRAQLTEYGKLMAERDNTAGRLLADLSDIKEARSLYREHLAHLNTATNFDSLEDNPSSNGNKMPVCVPKALHRDPSEMLKTRSCSHLNLNPPQSRPRPQLQPRELAHSYLPSWESRPSAPAFSPAATAGMATTSAEVQPIQDPPRLDRITTPDRRRTEPNLQAFDLDSVTSITLASTAAINSTAPTTNSELLGFPDTPFATLTSVSPFSFHGAKRCGPSLEGLAYSNNNELSYVSDQIADFPSTPSAEGARSSLCRNVSSACEGYGLSAASTLAAAASHVKKLLSGDGKLDDDGESAVNTFTSPIPAGCHMIAARGATALGRHPYICRRSAAHNSASSVDGTISSVRAKSSGGGSSMGSSAAVGVRSTSTSQLLSWLSASELDAATAMVL